MKTLALTSPHMLGEEVKSAQRLLTSNVFHTDFLQDMIDGEFGRNTAQAILRAKYWAGYPEKEILPIYGDQLDGLLRGGTLPLLYARRRKSRLANAPKETLGQKALKEAKRDLGMKEHPPNSNRCPISDAWGFPGPWCAMAVSTWYLRAGSKAFKMGKDYAYVPYMLAAAERNVNGLYIVRAKQVKTGDIVCFDWNNDGEADHTGLVDDNGYIVASFNTTEGNTGIGNDSNGGQVMERKRVLGNVARYNGLPAFIRVSK